MSNEVTIQDLPATINLDREMTVKELVGQSLKIHQILEGVMVEDIHYGRIPGTEKPTLYQAGAEKICTTFRLAPKYDVEDLSDPNHNLYRYRAKCSLYSIRDGIFVGSAMGEASTAEEKYQWEAAVSQKHWESTDADRRRIKFKKDGSEILQVQRNCADLANTVLKIACKRAFVSATKGATAASDLLDVDLDEEAVAELKKSEGEPAPKPKAKTVAPKFPYGKWKGKSIDDPEVTMDDLTWWINRLDNDLKEGKNKQYERANRELLAAFQAELARREKEQPQPKEKEPEEPKTAAITTQDAWIEQCLTWYDFHKDFYAQVAGEFKILDPAKLSKSKWGDFQKRMAELLGGKG